MKQRGSIVLILIGLLLFVLAAPAPAPAAVSVNGYVLTLIKWSDKICCDDVPKLAINSVPLDKDVVGPGASTGTRNKELDNNQFSVDARRSRVWVGWTDDVQGIKMSGRIEGDFNTTDGNALTSNSRHFRVRTAFARADHPSGFFILAGQHQSITASTDIAFTGKWALDEFNSQPDNLLGNRQPQVRVGWNTKIPAGQVTIEASVEKNSTENLGSANVDESQGEGQDVPFFGVRGAWDSPIVRLQGGVGGGPVVVTLAGGSQERETAWVVWGEAEVKPIPMVTLFGHVHTQKGFGRIHGGGGDFSSAGLTVDNKLELIEATAFYAGVSFQLTPATAINFIYGWAKADEDTSIGFTGDVCGPRVGRFANQNCLEKHESFSLILRHRFWQRWLTGLQLNHYKIETFAGTEGDATMVEAALFYFF